MMDGTVDFGYAKQQTQTDSHTHEESLTRKDAAQEHQG